MKLVCDHVGWNQIVTIENEDTLTKDDRKLVRTLNRVLRVLSGVRDWPFLRSEGEIITTAEYNQGTARMTNGSTAVTGQDDPSIPGTLLPVWTVAMVGRAFVANGDPLIYRVTAVNSATSITLNRAWQGDTTDGTDAAPDRSYKILQDRYDMPLDMDRPIDEGWSLHTESNILPIRVVDPTVIRRRRDSRFPAAAITDPEVVSIWAHDTQGEHRVAILDPFPPFQRVITFEYNRVHPTMDRDTQRILFPSKYEEVVVDGVEFALRAGPDDDTRADMALAEYLRTRTEALSTREIGQQRVQLTPSQGRAIQQNSKWGRRGVRINYGSWFDRKDFYGLP